MNKLIEALELYARIHDIPIMEKEGITWLQELIKQNNVKSILEIGSAIGYSAIQMARIDPSITITTIEKDEHRYERAKENIAASGLQNQIELILGDGLEFVPVGSYDLIFIDAAKAKYEQFFQRFSSYCQPNGIIVSDNMKFHGLVADPSTIRTRGTRKLVQRIGEYQEYLRNHAFFHTEFVDVGDGVAVSRRKLPHISDLDAVIFDMDGTMLDSERHFVNQCKLWNSRLDTPLDIDDDYFRATIGKNTTAIAAIFKERFGDAYHYETYCQEVDDLMHASFDQEGVPIKPGLFELLDLLKRHQIKLGVATSTAFDTAKKLLEKANVLPYFDVVVGGDMVANSKPHPEIYLEAAKQLGVSCSRTLVIEDSNPGVESGARGGFGTIMVVDLIPPTKQSEEIAIQIYNKLQQVTSLLTKEKQT